MSPGDTGLSLVPIWRSSGRSQGHRNLKGSKFLFPQFKTSIGNNSRSLKHRPTAGLYGVFDYGGSNGVTAILSRARKWRRVTKCTHSRRLRRRTCCL